MGIKAIDFSKDALVKIGVFKALPKTEINGSYWDRDDDVDLKKLKKEIKNHYLKAQDYTCPYCRQRVSVKHNAAWDTEHIIPKSSHPELMFESINLCISCKDCNTEKGNKNVLVNKDKKTLPESGTDYIIIHPHLDEYNEHIKVVDGNYFIPTSLKGRRTIEVCGLLRFVYEYVSYSPISIDAKTKVAKLTSMLMEANNATEEAFIVNLISDLTAEMAKSSRMSYLEKL
ncbi:TPA: HNH endonuclease [Aeromonas dhakensis]|uniref:HNH endonuclease n=1 Tax=Aeromonas dhakensis TaxID=196024 RepID=UPI001CF074AC|nr:HNH endonuclease [Aeromonas dhakensis]UCM43979.1 HNH endonuclease [Aeromonas dhakensis]HDX8341101.1 HNH endonuclease [Aeromonas dhakensis]